MEINRRNFLEMTPALLLTPLPKEAESSGALVCQWHESPGCYLLWVGRDEDLGNFQGYGATLEGVMWRNTWPDGKISWTFRFGRFFYSDYQANSVEDAKRFAELKLVEWMKQLVVEVERLAFRITRND